MAGPMRISLFRGMDEAERAEAWDALRVREKDYKKGEIILLAGEPVEAMGLVLQGSVTVSRQKKSPGSITSRTLHFTMFSS